MELRDSIGTILLRLLIIQGLPILFMCICCFKMYKKRKLKQQKSDNNYHRYSHCTDPRYQGAQMEQGKGAAVQVDEERDGLDMLRGARI